MSTKTIFGNILLLVIATFLAGQESQTSAPAQPSSSIYNRMRRVQMSETGPHPAQGRQQTTQQFPVPAGQFPPEQRGNPVPAQQPSNPGFPRSTQAGMQPSSTQPGAQAAQPQAAQQNQAPYGLALQPPNPPRISFAGGELTVLANNSSLSDIVNGIERAIGARLEGTPPDTERVFGQFGPASPRDVLNDLFSGSKYDFILVGGLDDPGAVQKIILSPHGTTPTPTTTASNQPRQPQNNSEDQEDNDNAAQANEVPSEAPNVQSEAPQPPPAPASGQQQQQQQVKTPEQLLQELQRLRQQQQQQPQHPR